MGPVVNLSSIVWEYRMTLINGAVSNALAEVKPGTIAVSDNDAALVVTLRDAPPLSAGAATSAKQPVIGTPGIASSDVLTVQGIAGMTALKIDGSAAIQPISGTVSINNFPSAQPVTGTFFQATQPISGEVAVNNFPPTQLISGIVAATQSGPWTVNLASASIEIGKVDQGSANTAANSWPINITDGTNVLGTNAHPVKVDPTGSTIQPVSGTVTVNAGSGTFAVNGIVTSNVGTTGGLALDTTLTAGTQKSRITDGTNTAAVKPASTAALATDQALVVSISPNNSVAVTGSFFQSTQPVSGSLTVTQTTAANLNAIVTQGTAGASAWKVDGSSVTQPISGSVTINGSVPVTGTFFQATQPVSAASLPLPTNASIASKQPAIGTAGSSSVDVLTVQGIASMTPFKVDGSGVTQPISGTITANAGSGNFTVAQSTAANLNATVTQGAAGSTAWKTDGSSVTQPVSATALPLPTGAAISSKQPSLGTAGAASLDVLTVQGAVGMTALKVDGSSVTQPVSGSVSVGGSVAVTGTFFQTTQPVSGTLTANAGTGLFNIRGGAAISTYSGNTVAFTPVAGDIFVITGSATKTVKILRIILCGTQTTAGNVNTISIIKRSSANSAGTAVALTKVPFDSTSPASTIVAQHYTAAPTPGTAVGTLWGPRATIPAPATVNNVGESGASAILIYDHNQSVNGQLPTLRGVGESLAINLSAVPTGAANFEVQISWTEE